MLNLTHLGSSILSLSLSVLYLQCHIVISSQVPRYIVYESTAYTLRRATHNFLLFRISAESNEFLICQSCESRPGLRISPDPLYPNNLEIRISRAWWLARADEMCISVGSPNSMVTPMVTLRGRSCGGCPFSETINTRSPQAPNGPV